MQCPRERDESPDALSEMPLPYDLKLGRIDDDVPDSLPLPGVGGVNHAVGGLNDRGVAVLAGVGFERQSGVPNKTIVRQCKVERRATLGRVIVDQQMTTIAQGHGVSPRVRIGKRCQFQ